MDNSQITRKIEKELAKIPYPETLLEAIDLAFDALEDFEKKYKFSFYYKKVLDTDNKLGCLMGAIFVKYDVDWDFISEFIFTNVNRTKMGKILWCLSDICGQNYNMSLEELNVDVDTKMETRFCKELHGFNLDGLDPEEPADIQEYIDKEFNHPDDCDYPDRKAFDKFVEIVGNIKFNFKEE